MENLESFIEFIQKKANLKDVGMCINVLRGPIADSILKNISMSSSLDNFELLGGDKLSDEELDFDMILNEIRKMTNLSQFNGSYFPNWKQLRTNSLN